MEQGATMTRNRPRVPGYRPSPITAYRWMDTELYFERRHHFHSIVNRMHRWHQGWNEAIGVISPQWWSMAGFYSFKTAELAVSRMEFVDYAVMVEISIAGTIVEHEVGYRSEYCKLERIMGWGDVIKGHMIRELRDRYEMDVARTNFLDGRKAAEFFGLLPLWKDAK